MNHTLPREAGDNGERPTFESTPREPARRPLHFAALIVASLSLLLAADREARSAATPESARSTFSIRGIGGPQRADLGDLQAPFTRDLGAFGIDTIAIDVPAGDDALASRIALTNVRVALRDVRRRALTVSLALHMNCSTGAPSRSRAERSALLLQDRRVRSLAAALRADPSNPRVLWSLRCVDETMSPEANALDSARAEAILRSVAGNSAGRILDLPSLPLATLASVARRVPDADAVGISVRLTGRGTPSEINCTAGASCLQAVMAEARRRGIWTKPWFVDRLLGPTAASVPTETLLGVAVPVLPSTREVADQMRRALEILARADGPRGVIVDGWSPAPGAVEVAPDHYFIGAESGAGVDRSHLLPTAPVFAIGSGFGSASAQSRGSKPESGVAPRIRFAALRGRVVGRVVLSGSSIRLWTGDREAVKTRNASRQQWLVSDVYPNGQDVPGSWSTIGHGPQIIFRPVSSVRSLYRLWTIVRGAHVAAATSLTFGVCPTLPCPATANGG